MKKQFQSVLRRQEAIFFVAPSLILVAFYAITLIYPIPQTTHTAIASIQSPRLLVKKQPDSPLRLSVIESDLTDTQRSEIKVVVDNATGQSVRAYAIRYEISSGHSRTSGTELTNKMSLSSVLQPGQSEPAFLDKGTFQPDVINSITISVDFVECVDGTTWGPDINKSRERLIGLRAGARAATRHLRRVLKEGGPQAVMNAIKENIAEIPPRPGRSPEWLDGFRGGVGAIRARLDQAYSRSGMFEIESELRRPFDASERRR